MTLPKIEGPVTGGNGPFVGGVAAGLAEHDYTQTEYFLAGTAEAYELGSDGAAKPIDTADYRTRILVYRPADAARFNGTVVVEWLNVSGGVDGCPDWTFLHREMMRSGYAWVGVSAQLVGVHGGQAIMEAAGAMSLTEVDPERYGSLSHPGDTFSFDIYSQAGAVARGVDGTVLAELPVERVIAIGESQSAMRLTTYVNAVDPVAQVYDGFFVHARGRSGSPLDESGPMRDPVGTARAVPRRPARAGALLRGRDRPDGPRLLTRRANPTTTGSGCGRWPGTSHADVYTFVAGFIDSGALPIAELAAAVEAHDVAARLRARAAAQHRAAALRAPGRARRTSIAGCATARRHRPRPRLEVRDDDPTAVRRRRARQSRAAVSARRTSTCRSRSSPASATTARRSRRICGTTDPVQRGEARVALLEQGRLLRQVRRRNRRRRRRRLVPRSRRPRDQGHRRRALPA